MLSDHGPLWHLWCTEPHILNFNQSLAELWVTSCKMVPNGLSHCNAKIRTGVGGQRCAFFWYDTDFLYFFGGKCGMPVLL